MHKMFLIMNYRCSMFILLSNIISAFKIRTIFSLLCRNERLLPDYYNAEKHKKRVGEKTTKQVNIFMVLFTLGLPNFTETRKENTKHYTGYK